MEIINLDLMVEIERFRTLRDVWYYKLPYGSKEWDIMDLWLTDLYNDLKKKGVKP